MLPCRRREIRSIPFPLTSMHLSRTAGLPSPLVRLMCRTLMWTGPKSDVSPSPFDGSAPMGTAKNPLWCRIAIISFKVMNITQGALIGVPRRGNARSPVSFAGVLQRVMAYGPAVLYHRDWGSMVARCVCFGVFLLVFLVSEEDSSRTVFLRGQFFER